MSSIATATSFNAPPNLPPPTRPTEQGFAEPHVVIATDDIFGSQNFDPDALTPDALMTYLSTRLNSINDQTQGVLERQKCSETVRHEVGEIKKLLTTLDTNEDAKDDAIEFPEETRVKLEEHLNNIAIVNPKLAQRISEDLHKQGQVLQDGQPCTTARVDSTKEYLDATCKDIESSAQMDMINLQSLMGARQTAIQLSTNLVAALAESMKAVVTNIR
ncbi:MAG TPA: hypothetical protein VG937_01190 [Polyangiaceae bacterium]|nr:hypothetical protein [Polyangiaceae bacterium]